MINPIRMMAKIPHPIAKPTGDTFDHCLIITGAGIHIGELVSWWVGELVNWGACTVTGCGACTVTGCGAWTGATATGGVLVGAGAGVTGAGGVVLLPQTGILGFVIIGVVLSDMRFVEVVKDSLELFKVV